MVDFKKAISDGIAAASQAETNNNEINSVISDLAIQTEEVTEGIVTISIGRFSENGLMETIINPLMFDSTSFGFEGLAALHKGNPESRTLLAKLERSATGYPVLLVLGDESFGAFNKAEFVDALLNLMMQPEVGKKIRQ